MKNRAVGVRWALAAACLLVLAAAAWSVWQFERVLRQGQTVLLELAPVDPRSLMQGDYMALRYALETHLEPSGQSVLQELPRFAYLHLDAQNRASWAGGGADARLSAQAVSSPRVVSVRIRPGRWGARLGPNAFFFQEGTAQQYEKARWGEFKVAPDGRALLVALRDANLNLLGANRF